MSGIRWQSLTAKSHKRRRREELAEKFPAKLKDLIAAAAASKVKVKKLTPGVALNWRPSWMKQTDHFIFEHRADDVPIPDPHIQVVD